MRVLDLAPNAALPAPAAFRNRFQSLGDAFFTPLADFVVDHHLHALAQPMLPRLGEGDAMGEAALAAIEPFRATFEAAFPAGLAAKSSLLGKQEGDVALIDALMRLMASEQADFTILFRRFASFDSCADANNSALRDLFCDRPAFDAWALRYRERLAQQDRDAWRRAATSQRSGDSCASSNGHSTTSSRRCRRTRDAADADFPPAWAQSIEVSCSS